MNRLDLGISQSSATSRRSDLKEMERIKIPKSRKVDTFRCEQVGVYDLFFWSNKNKVWLFLSPHY